MELKKLDEKLDEIGKNVHTIRSRCDELDVEVKKHQGLLQAVEDTTKAMEEIQAARQEEKAEQVAMAETVKTLEEKLVRAAKSAANDPNAEKFPEYGQEFNRYLKKGIDPSKEQIQEICKNIVETKFKGASAEEIQSEIKTMVVGSNPRGGYWVRPEVSTRMIKRIFETSPMLAIANVISIASDRIDIVIDDNEAGDGGWVGEVQSRPETTTPEIGELTILAHELYAQPKVTQKFLDDAAIDVEAWLQGKATRKMTRTRNTAYINGDGSKKPKGIMSYPDATNFDVYQRGAISTLLATGTSGVLDEPNDLKKLQNGLKEEYQANAVWLMKRSTFGDVIVLQDSTGQYIFETRFLNSRDDQMLLGKRIWFMNDLQAVAAGNYPIAYGDFMEGYTIVERSGFRVIRDEVTEKPFIKYYTTQRTGGDVTSYESWNRLKMN